MDKRYSKNISALSQEESEKLADFIVCVIGCGGLGGYVIEMLSRIGIGNITVVDMDIFDESNLNRQILSSENNLGSYKVEEARNRVKSINSNTKIKVINEIFCKENAEDILKEHHIIVDCLDSIDSRILLQEVCKRLNIIFVHGAIGGWYGQVCTVFPGSDTLSRIYKGKSIGIEKKLGNPSFTPANIASIEVSEVIKVLLNKGEILRDKLLIVDLLYNDYNIIDLEK
ncbi:MAG: HesA/MoeB/ThiF family protein [Terrisporobacter sp.]|uniref:HesA/MoeB/ThiF family protein n=1 Tax=Terrisporobacter sp. TaxID=1965305 RepID=UPI002FC7A484